MTKKNRTAKNRPFKSKYYGECGVCNEFFVPGLAKVTPDDENNILDAAAVKAKEGL